MTREEAIRILKYNSNVIHKTINGRTDPNEVEALDMAIEALEQEPIDKSAMMYDIYMEGVNMSGEYQGCWVRFKNIEKIVDKYMGSE